MTEKQQPKPEDLELVDHTKLVHQLAAAYRIQHEQLNEKDRTITELRETNDQQQTEIAVLRAVIRGEKDDVRLKTLTILDLRGQIASLRSDIEHHECGPDGR